MQAGVVADRADSSEVNASIRMITMHIKYSTGISLCVIKSQVCHNVGFDTDIIVLNNALKIKSY